MDPLLVKVLDVAASKIGIRETPPKSNRGPEIDEWIRYVGFDPEKKSTPYCAAFVCSMFRAGAALAGLPNPCPQRGGSWLKLWERSHLRYRRAEPEPGAVFLIDHGGGKGHVGFVESVDGDVLTTVEANTNPAGSREGDGVYRRTRKRSEINVGYLVFADLAC